MAGDDRRPVRILVLPGLINPGPPRMGQSVSFHQRVSHDLHAHAVSTHANLNARRACKLVWKHVVGLATSKVYFFAFK